MSRPHPKFAHGYVHAISPTQAVDDNISGNAFLMLAWAHDFCRRRKRDVVTTREFFRSGVAIDGRTIRKYLRGLVSVEHVEQVSRGRWRILSLGCVGYKQPPTASDATKNVLSTQPLKAALVGHSAPPKAIIPESPAPALLDQKALSQKLKAGASPLLERAANAAAVDTISAPAPQPVAAIALAQTSGHGGAVEAKAQVVRQAGPEQKSYGAVAAAVMSVGTLTSGMSLQDFMDMPEVDLDALDTEALLQQNRKDVALLSASKTTAKALGGQPPGGLQPQDPDTFVPPSVPLTTTQRLPKSIIRFNLEQIAQAVPDFTYGEREVNAFGKWPVTEAQLVDLKNTAVARKRKGKLTVGVGAYLYGAVRRASLGLAPTRR